MVTKKKPIIKPVGYPHSYFDKKQVKIGTSIEMEHTTSRKFAQNIAEQHLVEGINYYKLLPKMEKKLIKGKQFITRR